MEHNPNVIVKRDQFTNWLNSESVSDAQIDGLMSQITLVELFHYFLLNSKLKKYHALASKTYGARSMKRPINIMWNDDSLTAYDNEVRIKSSLNIVKRLLKPIKEHVKWLKLNFIHLDDELPAALTFIHNTFGKTLEWWHVA